MDTPDIKRSVRVIHPTVKIKNKNLDISPYVKAIETYKSLKNPAGAFAIELSPRNKKDNITSYNMGEELYKNIDSMDIIEIGITKPGLMVGLVDSIDKTKAMHTENYSRSLAIKGRDFAKLLIEDSVVYSPQLFKNENLEKLLGNERLAFVGKLDRGSGFGGNASMFNNPVCAVLFIIKNIPAVHVEIPFTDVSSNTANSQMPSGKAGQFFICDLKAFLGDRVKDLSVSQMAGKVWNTLMQCIDENFYEMFVDTIAMDGASGKEARPCLFMRPKPFDRTTDNVILIKDSLKTSRPPLETAGDALSKLTEGDISGVTKAVDAGAKVYDNLVKFNQVINPRIERGDIIIVEKKSSESSNKSSDGKSGGGTGNISAAYVSLAGMDSEGKISNPQPPQFQGERDVNNPADPNNKSMIIPWTWDGKDSFFRTMVTDEPYHTIYDHDIIEESFGVADFEVINYITIRSRKDLNMDPKKALLGLSFPLMDTYKIKRFGMRAFNAESNLLHDSYRLAASGVKNYEISSADKKDVFSSSEYVNNRERLFNWYRYNEILENGVVVIRGNQDIRIGDKIFMPDAITKGGRRGIYAYVQGVKNRFEYTQSGVKFETTLELVRGENQQDLEDYRSQVNSGSGSDLKLGTTYKNYDESIGAEYQGSPEDPKAHNIVKFDGIKVIDNTDPDSGNRQKPVNQDVTKKDDKPSVSSGEETTGLKLTPKYSGYISKYDYESAANILKMFGENLPFEAFSGTVQNEIDGGSGTAEGNTVNVDGRVFMFLEAVGSLGFPFRLKVKSIVGEADYYIEGDDTKQVSPNGLGRAVEIAVEGSPGTEDYIKRTTALVSYILGLPEIDEIGSDNRLSSLLHSRNVFPSMLITCPNQDDSKDLKLCKGMTILSEKIKTKYKDRIQVVF